MKVKLHHFLRLIFSLLLITTSSRFTTNAEVHRSELDSATYALRSVGYTLFGNSISVSDLLYQILAGDSFTLLAPPDNSLFSLDMSTDAFSYIHSLRYHIIPHRHISYSDLRNISLSKFPYLETLVPNHFLFVSTRRTRIAVLGGNLRDVSEAILVDGVRVAEPDVYIGPSIVVHGLDGTLDAGVSSSDNFGGGEFVLPPIRNPERHPPSQTPSPAFISDFNTPSSEPIEAFSPLFGQLTPYPMSPFPFHYPSISIPPAISPPIVPVYSRPPLTSAAIWNVPSTGFEQTFSSPDASPGIWSRPPVVSGGISPWSHDSQENDGHGNATPQNAPSFSTWNHDHEEIDSHGNTTPQNAPSSVTQHHATMITPSAWNVPPQTYGILNPSPQSESITILTPPPPPVQWMVPPFEIPPPPAGESTGTGWRYVRKRPKKKHERTKRHQGKRRGHKAHAKSSDQGASSNANGEVQHLNFAKYGHHASP